MNKNTVSRCLPGVFVILMAIVVIVVALRLYNDHAQANFTVEEDRSLIQNHSLDFGGEDCDALYVVADLYGGDKEERAYTMLVTINRSISFGYSIPDLVELEVKRLASGQEPRYPHTEDGYAVNILSQEALHDIMVGKFDNSNGSLFYQGR